MSKIVGLGETGMVGTMLIEGTGGEVDVSTIAGLGEPGIVGVMLTIATGGVVSPSASASARTGEARGMQPGMRPRLSGERSIGFSREGS